MIQASELRIGNWVKTNTQIVGTNSPEFGKITQIYMDGFSVDYHYPSKWYEPIPLTPEILEKCGFEKVDDGISPFYKLIISKTEVISIEDDWSLGLNAKNEKSTQGYATNANICQHLHQLQNIYYALTGEELNYQP